MTDKEKIREEHKQERESVRALEDSFKLNIGNSIDRMLGIVTGEYRPPPLPNENPKITASVAQNGQWAKKEATRVIQDVEVPSSEQSPRDRVQYTESRKYASIIRELDRFPFSDDPNRCKDQMSIVSGAIRSAMQEMVLKEVATNTKKAFKEHVTGFSKIAGGLKANFAFDKINLSVTAKGSFRGDETICVYAEDSKVKAKVMRITEDAADDLSSDFDIKMEKK